MVLEAVQYYPSAVWSSVSDAFSEVPRLLFQAASYLTHPICSVRESYIRMYVVDDLYNQETYFARLYRKVALVFSMICHGFIAIPFSFLGVTTRFLSSHLQREPFLYVHEPSIEDKTLPQNRFFTVLLWNICCIVAGFNISDGGVVSWKDRIDRIIERISEKDADVICLNEILDLEAGLYLAEKLKEKGYPHIYYNIGPHAFVSSGLFVASKYKISEEKFTYFPLHTLVGRTKGAAKGYFSFTLQSREEKFARLVVTHL